MVLHYVKIQVKVLLKRFLYMRLLGQVVGALDSQPEGPEFESTQMKEERKPTGLPPASWDL